MLTNPKNTMVFYPNAKINIGLSVINKRQDGFHNIETVFYPIPLCDILTVETGVSEQFVFSCEGLELSGNDPITPQSCPQKGEYDNLCCKAFRLIDADFNLPPTRIHLRKVIPVGAGLGGGSSDAAYVLKALNDLYQLQLSNEKLKEYASRIGSDCTFFLKNTPAIGTGKGEILEPINLSLSDYHIFLVKPPLFVSTAEAYSSVIPRKLTSSAEFAIPPHHLPDLLQAPVIDWRNTVFNDFEKSIFKKYPEISIIKELLYSEGAIYASMSGSGSSVYGIFKERPKEIEKLFPNCFCWNS